MCSANHRSVWFRRDRHGAVLQSGATETTRAQEEEETAVSPQGLSTSVTDGWTVTAGPGHGESRNIQGAQPPMICQDITDLNVYMKSVCINPTHTTVLFSFLLCASISDLNFWC